MSVKGCPEGEYRSAQREGIAAISWLHAHTGALRDALRHGRRAPLGTLFSIIALAVALALPVIGLIVVDGLARIAAGFDIDPQISLFLPTRASAGDRQTLERRLRARTDVKRLRVITREQALADLQTTEGVRDLLAGLADNPLPDTLVVTPANPARSAIRSLQAELERTPGIASVQVDAAWIERLERLLRGARTLLLALAIALAAAIVAVTFNTIRLQVATRAAELGVAALFGATRAWLRRPFLYFGAVQGFAAGTLSVALALGFVALLRDEIAGEAPAALALAGVGARTGVLALTVVLIASFLGWLGAWLAVSEHLRRSGRSPS